jgi:hypothetical protein
MQQEINQPGIKPIKLRAREEEWEEEGEEEWESIKKGLCQLS